MKAHLCCALICFFGVANFVENRICVVESFVVSSSSTLSLSSTSSSINRPLSWNDRHRYWHHSAAAAVLVLNDAVQNIRGEIDDEWKGEVVPGGSMMRGCTIQEAKKEDNNNENESSSASAPCTEFVIRIDGVEADLGRFSNAIYKQLMIEAKQQRFQGFRPGTIPPHLYNTYKAYALDETCRETILEAMQQNSIRPFTNARQDMRIEQVSIPPPSKTTAKKKNKKKYKKKKKKSKNNDTDIESDIVVEENVITTEEKEEEKEEEGEKSSPSPPQWQVYKSMDDAIKAGKWVPGQSFSFIATNVKGQNVLSDNDTKGAISLAG